MGGATGGGRGEGRTWVSSEVMAMAIEPLKQWLAELQRVPARPCLSVLCLAYLSSTPDPPPVCARNDPQPRDSPPRCKQARPRARPEAVGQPGGGNTAFQTGEKAGPDGTR